jgi:hypothetical protein
MYLFVKTALTTDEIVNSEKNPSSSPVFRQMTRRFILSANIICSQRRVFFCPITAHLPVLKTPPALIGKWQKNHQNVAF